MSTFGKFALGQAYCFTLPFYPFTNGIGRVLDYASLTDCMPDCTSTAYPPAQAEPVPVTANKPGVPHITRQSLIITQPKTKKSRHPITLLLTAKEALKNHLETVDINSTLVFNTSSGRPILPRNVVRHFKSVIALLGLLEI